MMRVKPKVCLIDDDVQTKLGWEQSLGAEAELIHFASTVDFYKMLEKNHAIFSTVDCAIVGRYLENMKVDLFDSDIPILLKNYGVGAVFLNWQGYLTKEEINAKFDGRLFSRYGVRWQTLRARVLKVKIRKVPVVTQAFIAPSNAVLEQETHIEVEEVPLSISKSQRCKELLLTMAKNAIGSHRERLEYYAESDDISGMQLLEALYNRLLTARENSLTCPSRYINSSPVVAKNILHKTLFDS